MALINCPECNNEISDKAKSCPHCGCELSIDKPMFYGEYCPSCLETSLRFKKEDKLTVCPYCNTQMIDSIYGVHNEVCNFTDNHPELKQSTEFSEEAYQRRINFVPVEYSSSNSIKCPTCKSTNVRKMSGLETGTSVAMFGLFSRKINKTFKCENCGYTW